MTKYDIQLALEGESAADVYGKVATAMFLADLDPQTLIVRSAEVEEEFQFPAIQSAIKGLSNGTE